ncbi:MAG: efflux RND transporter periplasmic adaptor subunit [Deltaproteobacteria bacterium]|nr:efflux RND transporter periplasmic adaptor subunit [Deltaproteobacteria bacterium]
MLTPDKTRTGALHATSPSAASLSAWVALAAVALGGCAPNAQAQGKQKTESPVHVETVDVVERPMPEYATLTGTLSAWQQSEIAADAAGKVLATLVERGQKVKKGEVIARLDARTSALASKAAQVQVKLADTQAALAAQDCARGQSLYDNKAISDAEYQRIMTQCSSARWSKEAAEANRAIAAKGLVDSSIRSPLDGVIGERYVNVGEFVQPSTRVASVYAVDPLRLEVTVPEAAVGMVREGLSVELKVAAWGDETFAGTVRFISPNIRRTSRDLVMEAVVPNPQGRLRPGMFATVRLLVSERPSPVVPSAALKKDVDGARVFAVVDGKINERIVQAGEQKDGLIAVLRGVAAGDRIVTNPSAEVRDGRRVE